MIRTRETGYELRKEVGVAAGEGGVDVEEGGGAAVESSEGAGVEEARKRNQ